MAALAQTPIGAREALEGIPSASSFDSPRSSEGRSPRCEAFVMTGDKILNLNPNISPCYAKLNKEQLPPRMAVHDTPRRTITTPDFPSVRRGRMGGDSVRKQLFSPRDSSSVESGDVNGAGDQHPSTSEEPSRSSSQEEKENMDTTEGRPSEVPPLDMKSSHHMECNNLMQSSYHSTAHSNPQLSSRERRGSTDTFVISSSSPVKSTVTVNAIGTSPSPSQPTTDNTPSVSGNCSPAVRRLLSPRGTMSMDSRCDDQKDAASRLATRLFCLNGFTRAEVAQQLDLENDFAALTSEYYMGLLQFSGIRIDAALREFLTRVELIGETAQREKLLRHFSARYHTCNPAVFAALDDVHALTCALLLLNSDLHGPNCGRKMAVRDFINNLSHTGGTYDRALLKNLYSSIKTNPIVADSDRSRAPSGAQSTVSVLPRSGTFRLAEVDPESQVEYKGGWVLRKSVYDADGTKTPLGRRGWKMWYARLRGLALYLDREEHPKKRSKWETFTNSILLHHSIAEPALDYKKKQHCFRLRTAGLGEFLFHTSDAKDVQSWVESINFVCAAFSARALPPAAGSMTSFNRPRLPNLPSTASMVEQLRNHDSAGCELRAQLENVREFAPPLKSRGRQVEEFFFKERFLTQEIDRYRIYATVLRSRLDPGTMGKMGGASSDSTSGVHSKSDIGEDMDKISYKEAMHQM